MDAVSSTLVKDEVLIWLSRYRRSVIGDFLKSLRALIHLEMVNPNLLDEEEAAREFGKHPLGISDLININIMKRLNIDMIATSDKGFDKYPGIKRLFSEFSEEVEFRDFISKLQEKGFKIKFKL